MNTSKSALSPQAKKRLRRKRNARIADTLTVLACIVLPPLGIYLVWRRKWSVQVRYALTALGTVVMAAVVFLMPAAERKVPGGVTVIGSEKSADVYGPELPDNLVAGYTQTSDSVLTEAGDSNITYYYAAKGEKYYHDYNCAMAYASSQKLTLYEAYYLGYQPCPQCTPPEYTGLGVSKPAEASETSSES